MAGPSSYVIVGASLAGAKAAEGMREAGFDGRIVLIGDEPERPYERPPLSKGYLKGDDERDSVFVHAEDWYDSNGVELVLGQAATAIDRTAHEVQLADGQRIPYAKLLLATGSAPRRLQVTGGDLEGVHYLRRVEDCESIGASLRAGGQVVIVGGGWIGLEVASAARHHGNEVTIVEPQPAPLMGPLGRELGDLFAQLHRDHGVDVRTDTGIDEFEGVERVSGVRTDKGDRLPADTVVVGVGIRPVTDLAEHAGLAVDNGIVVDEMLRTSDPDIYAAGDVANALTDLYGRHLRVEHWANALNQGSAAGRSMAGKGEPWTTLPFFFTDQYDLGMEYRGHTPDGHDQLVYRGDPASLDFIVFWLKDGRVQAGMNVNRWDDGDAIEELARTRAVADPDRLADESVPLGT